MDLNNKTILITGASSGIGAACAAAFAERKARVIVMARREERLHELAEELMAAARVHVHVLACDVRDNTGVNAAVAHLPEDWRQIDVLVNNAGLSRGLSPVHQGEIQDWDEMIDTNVKGLLYVSRAVLPGMVERGSGHVINIGSIAGHDVYPNGNVYCATKFAVDALTKGMRMDLLGTGVRVTTVDPGLVETEFSIVRFRGDESKAKVPYRGMIPLTPADVADAVVYCATRPAHVTVNELILMPTAQASATMVLRDA